MVMGKAMHCKFKSSDWTEIYQTFVILNIINSIRDARTPQPGKIVFNTMRYRSSETVHRLGYFQSSVSVQIMFK